MSEPCNTKNLPSDVLSGHFNAVMILSFRTDRSRQTVDLDSVEQIRRVFDDNSRIIFVCSP